MQSILLTIKRAFWGIFLCVAIASFPLPSLAVTVKEVPNPRQVYRGWVTDTANILSPETQATLNQLQGSDRIRPIIHHASRSTARITRAIACYKSLVDLPFLLSLRG